MWSVFGIPLLVAFCIGSNLVQAQRKVELGSVKNFEIPITGRRSANADLKVHAIQEDQYITGNILAAVGSAVYTMDEFGTFTLLAGSPGEPGYRTGWHTTARFNETAGIAQISNNELIVADKNNQCLRKIYRTDNEVITYAGTCNGNRVYTEGNYTLWETFNSPTTLHYDSSRRYLYVLDVMEAGVESVIVYNNVLYSNGYDQGRIKISQRAGYLPTDFFYDSDAETFFIARKDLVFTVKWSSNGLQKGSNIDMKGVYGVTSRDDVVVGSKTEDGYIIINDTKTANVITLCDDSSYYLASCPFNKPTAVSITYGKLYVGTLKKEYWMSLNEVKAYVSYLPFSISSDKTTTNGWESETTTVDSFGSVKGVNSNNYYDDSYYSSSSGGLGAGTIAIIIIACIAGLALKIALITWRVRRWSNRFNCRRGYGTTTIVAVNSTTTAVPYGRLQESGPPSGQFPTPPPYTPPMQMQHPPPAAPRGQQPPAVHYPLPTSNNRY